MPDARDKRIAILEATLARIAAGLADEDDIWVNREWTRAQVASVLPYWVSKLPTERALRIVR